MRKIVCDICKNTSQYCRYYASKKRWLWRFDNDSGGGNWTRLDICDGCWAKFNDYVKEYQSKETQNDTMAIKPHQRQT